MPGNTLKLSGKVREMSGNFILPKLWEPCRPIYHSFCAETMPMATAPANDVKW